MIRALAGLLAPTLLALTPLAIPPAAGQVVGDGMPAPLAAPGDPARGRAIVLDRQLGNCLLCHAMPFADEPFEGNIGPPLAGVGARLDAAQIRLRLVDASVLNPDTIMPPYHRTEGLARVAPAYRGKPVLDAQQVEDVIAFLLTLKEEPK